jgi:hypothetical protein
MWHAYRLHERGPIGASHLHLCGRLFQEYVVTAWANAEMQRLRWQLKNQQTLRAESYRGLMDALNTGAAPAGIGPSFQGGNRHMSACYNDAMAIVRDRGKPDLFVTMTCNPSWPEITRELSEGQDAKYRPDLCARVFKLKLDEMMQSLLKQNVLGKVCRRSVACAPLSDLTVQVIGHLHVIEFQKRGLPHAHILLILSPEHKPQNADDVDRLISACLPDPDVHPELYETVTTAMLHGPCGERDPQAGCMDEGRCTKKYRRDFRETTEIQPDGYPLYRRPNDGRIFLRKGGPGRPDVVFDNRDVVPHNPYLSTRFNCHINVEVCTSIRAIKYIYKYVYKGHDRAQAVIEANGEQSEHVDEIQRYIDARYVSMSECASLSTRRRRCVDAKRSLLAALHVPNAPQRPRRVAPAAAPRERAAHPIRGRRRGRQLAGPRPTPHVAHRLLPLQP